MCARLAPERVTRLALLDTSARRDTPEQTAAREKLIALAKAGKLEDVVAASGDPRGAEPELLELSPEDLATLHADVSAPGAAIIGMPYGDTDLVAVERSIWSATPPTPVRTGSSRGP